MYSMRTYSQKASVSWHDIISLPCLNKTFIIKLSFLTVTTKTQISILFLYFRLHQRADEPFVHTGFGKPRTIWRTFKWDHSSWQSLLWLCSSKCSGDSEYNVPTVQSKGAGRNPEYSGDGNALLIELTTQAGRTFLQCFPK